MQYVEEGLHGRTEAKTNIGMLFLMLCSSFNNVEIHQVTKSMGKRLLKLFIEHGTYILH